MTSYASILTITAFTVERYVAICHPIKAQTLSNLSRAMKTVFVIWVLSCTFALPYPIHTRVFPYVSINGTGIAESLQCNIPFEWQTRMTYAFQISTFLFFVFPMVIISVMYGIIGYKLRRSQLESKHKSKIRARKAVVRMLGKCYLPLCQPVKGFHFPLFIEDVPKNLSLSLIMNTMQTLAHPFSGNRFRFIDFFCARGAHR